MKMIKYNYIIQGRGKERNVIYGYYISEEIFNSEIFDPFMGIFESRFIKAINYDYRRDPYITTSLEEVFIREETFIDDVADGKLEEWEVELYHGTDLTNHTTFIFSIFVEAESDTSKFCNKLNGIYSLWYAKIRKKERLKRQYEEMWGQ